MIAHAHRTNSAVIGVDSLGIDPCPLEHLDEMDSADLASLAARSRAF